jgi:hypothetical protein
MPTPSGHLVGAYGLFWDRYLVDWQPGSGPAAWQLLGKRHKRQPALRVCDFRKAHGVYILYDDYTGLARGGGGLGARLRRHHIRPPHEVEWVRFSWFSFDDVVDDVGHHGWELVQHRAKPVPADSEAIVREMEALLITVLGTTQNKMRFQRARRWEQLAAYEAEDLEDHNAVDPHLFTFRRTG